jgi:hypothetical protein
MSKVRLQWWTDPEQIKKELAKRLQFSRQARARYEKQWEENERTVYATRSSGIQNSDVSLSFSTDGEAAAYQQDMTQADISINRTMKNLRFIHSQMSANPPTVIAKPTSADPNDRYAADAADRLVRYGIRHYQMSERKDQLNLEALIYGSGFAKCFFNTMKGEIADYDPVTEEVVMSGDFEFTVPSVWKIYPDADATTWDDVSYVFEEVDLRYEEAAYMFPDKLEVLERVRQKGYETDIEEYQSTASAVANKYRYDSVKCYQYWETGTPMNGMQGRFGWCLEDGTPLTALTVSPHRFTQKLKGGKPGPTRAYLPYKILTDIDVPGTYWGMSVVAYASAMQDAKNRVDTVMLDILQAHGVARIIMPESAEIADESITNSTWDVIKYTGSIPPSFMEPVPLPAALPNIGDRMERGIDDVFGINDAVMGNMQRETSGFSLQYATQQSNMIRKRLFNKDIAVVEWVYKTYLQIVSENWKETRTIKVLGKEKAFESINISGADIASGFDLVVEYGASLSLDPITRREEILQMMPLFQQAGVQPRKMLQMLKLTELENAYDHIELAETRQREIFEEMRIKGIYIEPQELEDHINMLAFAYTYVMTAEFKYLNPVHKEMINKHIKDREEMQASKMAGAGGMPGMPPMGAPPGGMPPPPPGGLPQ